MNHLNLTKRSAEEEMINMIGAMGQLFRVEAHIAKKREMYRRASEPVDSGIYEFYRYREDFIGQILDGLEGTDTEAPLFQEILVDMTPDELGYDRKAYLERFRFYRQFSQGQKTLQLIQAINQLHIHQAAAAALVRQQENTDTDKLSRFALNVMEAKRSILRLLLELDIHLPSFERMIHDLLPEEQLSACLDTLRVYQEKVKMALAG